MHTLATIEFHLLFKSLPIGDTCTYYKLTLLGYHLTVSPQTDQLDQFSIDNLFKA